MSLEIRYLLRHKNIKQVTELPNNKKNIEMDKLSEKLIVIAFNIDRCIFILTEQFN